MFQPVFEGNKSEWRLLSLFAVMGFASVAWAGPPFETDDPEPVEYQHWEIYLGGTAVNFLNTSTGTFPFLELNYGPLPDIQLSLTEQAAFNFPEGGLSYYGYGDGLAGVKWRFLHETEGLPQAAFFPQATIPTGDASKGLGAGQADLLLPLWFQKSWGPWTTYGGGGYWFNPGPGNRNWVFVGWEIQNDLSRSFTLGGEVFYHSANLDGVNDGMGFNLGGMIHLDEVNHIVFSFGRDFIQSEYTFTGYAAYEWTFSMSPEPAEKN
jgi:hypothetical protein